MTSIITIDSELTPPYKGMFPLDKVTDIFTYWLIVSDTQKEKFQIRIEQRRTDGDSYAGLYTWSNFSRSWVAIATRKIYSTYGIEALGAPYDPDIFSVITDELMDVARKFEGVLEDTP